MAVLDPCAGEGAAVVEIARILARGREAADARNEVRRQIQREEWRKEDLVRSVERCRQWRAGAEADLARKKNDPYRSDKQREKAVAKAEDRLRLAERNLQNALVAAGLEPPVAEPVAEPPVAEPPVAETVDEEVEAVEECGDVPDTVDFYTVEMERGRHEVLSGRFEWRDKQRALHGDAFCATFDPKKGGVGLLYLNPPYDVDKVCGRLEEKFLRRFTLALAPGGVLVFIVPYHALAASAETIARSYEDVACYRFAGDGFAAYKQVVVFARKLAVDRLIPDPEIRVQVEAWAARGAECPELPDAGSSQRAVYAVPMRDKNGDALADWKIQVVDVAAILGKFRPWHETTRRATVAIPRFVPVFPLVDVMHRTYEVATPPRPAHIAAGLAAGLFNGQRIEPDDHPGSKLPVLLVKGCFDREWRTVEEKVNKDGEKTGEVQVQTPKLVVTILDLEKHTYHTLRQETVPSVKPKADDLSVGDLLAHYGKSLTSVMERQCVILYDPRKDAGRFALVETPRKLFAAQAHAVRGILTVLADRAGVRQPILIGEIGSGKSTVALVAARSHGARRVLCFCPPHLLDSWRCEVAAVFPDADYRVLSSVTDVDAVRDADPDRFLVAVVSREAAKLGHRLSGVSGNCPRCGDVVVDGAEEIAKRRGRCAARAIVPENDFARYARSLALVLRAQMIEGSQYLPHLLSNRMIGLRRARFRIPDVEKPPYAGIPGDLLHDLREALVDVCKGDYGHDSPAKRALVLAVAAGGAAPEVVLDVARRIKRESYDYQHFAEAILLMLPPSGALGKAFEFLETFKPGGYGCERPVDWFRAQYAKLSGNDDESGEDDVQGKVGVDVGGVRLCRWSDGSIRVGGHEFGSEGVAFDLLKAIGQMAAWSQGPPCGEPLYQATPDPRRYPLAKYVVKHARKTFDFVIIDECHEAGNADSAQSTAAHRLTSLRLPTILMTGTIMNGYAESLFANFWATDMDFRREFARNEVGGFVERYGYRKRLVSDREDGKVVAYGSQSDRVERSEKDIGSAPGVLPLFLFAHLLKGAVTLHKSDLRIDLPALSQDRVEASADGDLLDEFQGMVKEVVDAIKADRYDEVLAGKIFGQLSELPSYLDRATSDVGNGHGVKDYEVHYPESVGGALVASGRLFPRDTILPKEALMLDAIEREVKEGRRAMVFGWHTELLSRLARLLQDRLGEVVPILYADKVPTAKRQAWIDKQIVGKKARVMVTNPVCIQTGLNNLVWFNTIWQHENPACNPIVDRQSIGRIDRIGARLPTRVFRAYYAGTLQEKMYALLMNKVAISTATDGLDPESAMLAAGIEPSSFVTGLSLGKALWAMMEEGMLDERPALRVVRGSS